jgi:hypothetical protein
MIYQIAKQIGPTISPNVLARTDRVKMKSGQGFTIESHQVRLNKNNALSTSSDRVQNTTTLLFDRSNASVLFQRPRAAVRSLVA